MDNNNYLIPANAKRGLLMFNFFRPIDLIILGIGVGVSIITLGILNSIGGADFGLFIALIPAGISVVLVMPVPNQHNILVLLGMIFKYFTTQQKYKWKGWSIYEDFE